MTPQQKRFSPLSTSWINLLAVKNGLTNPPWSHSCCECPLRRRTLYSFRCTSFRWSYSYWIKTCPRDFLVVLCLGIYLPMQGTWVPSLVREDPSSLDATRPMNHNWARVLQPLKPAQHPLQQEKPPQWEACTPQLESSPCSLQLEKAHVQQWRPNTA